MVENPTVYFSALCNSSAKIAYCSSELMFTSLYAGSNIQNAVNNSSCVSTFLLQTSLFIHTHKQKSDGVISVASKSSLSVTLQN